MRLSLSTDEMEVVCEALSFVLANSGKIYKDEPPYRIGKREINRLHLKFCALNPRKAAQQ